MNVNHESLQPLVEMLGKHLTKQIFIVSILWSIIAFIVITFIVKKFTQWQFLVPAAVTIFVSLFLVQFVHMPFDIINRIASESKTFDLYNTFKAQPNSVKLLLLIPLLIWRSLTAAIAHQWSFKIITYFDKKRTYNFGMKFFLSLFAACSIPGLFALLHVLIYYCSL
jgi:hypothetical protein